MSASASGFGSNNPFRRSTSVDPSPVTPATGGSTAPSASFLDAAPPPASTSTPRPPPFTTFRTAATEQHGANARGEEPVLPKPKKIVKKVRVQSPPPSSPEDATPVRRYPPHEYSDDSSSDTTQDVEQIDPFDSGFSQPPARAVLDDEPPLPRPPPNPFSKTLQDLEQNARAQEGLASEGGKGSLDVDSFKRLLLTGYSNIPGPGRQGGAGSTHRSQQPTAHDSASTTDASSVSRRSILETMQGTPRTSHEISEPEDTTITPSSPLANVQSAAGRKKPPPPSSRHGKLIKIELGVDGKTGKGSQPTISIDTSSPTVAPSRKSSAHSLTQPSPPSSSDINKPLPAPPRRATGEEDVDSPFDREAAGKLPESFSALSMTPRPPTPPGGSTRPRSESQASVQTTSSAQQKPAAPPPRRHGHTRSDSKPPSIFSEKTEEDPPRSSVESTRSRADSLRVNVSSDKNLSAPAPPPSRRPNHGRKGSSFASPTMANSTNLSSPGTSEGSRSPGLVGFNPMEHQSLSTMATVTHNKDGSPKLSPPPPPPARHSSLRRPTSAHSAETSSIRKVSREKEGGSGPPPPPPPRARGSSKASLSALDAIAPADRSRTGAEIRKLDEEPSPAAEDIVIEPGVGDDIMAQLRALQQEVEAARKGSE